MNEKVKEDLNMIKNRRRKKSSLHERAAVDSDIQVRQKEGTSC